MIEVFIKPSFVSKMNDLEQDLVEEALEKIELFKDPKNHKALKVHKLHGKLSGCYSFSVNYNFRIVFEYSEKQSVRFLSVGDHSMYR